MNKNTIVSILILISLICSESYSSTQFGVKMGMVSSKYEFKVQEVGLLSDVLFDNTRNGPIMGIYFRFLYYDFLNLESEFNYLQRGGQENIERATIEQPQGTGEEISYDVQFDYLQLQLNLRPYYPIKSFEVFGIVGISVNYLLGAKNLIVTNDNLRDFTFSYSLGAGVEVQFISNSLFIEFTLNSDISNIYKDLDREFKFKTYTIRLGIGI